MPKLLLFSHSGFSDTDANGITMKNLLSGFDAAEKAEFYCGTQSPDFSAAHHYFRVTDTQMIKAFLGKKATHIFSFAPENAEGEKRGSGGTRNPKKIPVWLKKLKYNFILKWLREYLWMLSPWGHGALKRWLRDMAPEIIVYMVGESIFMDKLVLKTCEETGKPLVLYHGEAFRIIDLRKRFGLERAYYRKVQKLYDRLNETASLVIYNSEMLQEDYELRYAPKAKAVVAYNSAACNHTPYQPGNTMNITYFGNLGVGRSDTLLQVAQVLEEIDPALRLDIYGNAMEADADRFGSRKNIRYHGFIDAAKLHEVVEKSDILLHVESFDGEIIPKLRYAFSTKIAQCLCAGRCFVSFAPEGTASSRYLAQADGAVLISERETLKNCLEKLVNDGDLRQSLACRAVQTGLHNHNMETTARWIREEMEEV